LPAPIGLPDDVETALWGHRFTKKMWCLFGTVQGG
jgi:hypothetical protein